MNGENQNNNNQNGFNFNQSMNDDAFNVFNQNAENFQKHLEEQRQAEAANQPATPPTPPVPTQINTVKTVEPKNKKKEPQKFDINNLDTLPTTKKVEKTPEEQEKDKKKKDIIILIVLIIVLIAVCFIAYTLLFSSGTTNVKEIETTSLKANSSNIEEISTDMKAEKKTDNYKCIQKIENLTNYNFPQLASIKNEVSTSSITYYSTDNSLTEAKQITEIKYSYLDYDAINEIKNYCNAYNKIEDAYQLLCNFNNNKLSLTNNFNIQKLDSTTITTNNITIDLNLKKTESIEDVIQTETLKGNSCSKLEVK